MWRALFRLWVVGSILWAGFLFFVASSDSRPDAWIIYGRAALVPPVLILILSLILRWALKAVSRSVRVAKEIEAVVSETEE